MPLKYKYSRSAYRIHDILNKGDRFPLYSYVFRRFIIVVVLIDMVGVLLRTFDLQDNTLDLALYTIGVISAFVFFVEYVVRIWTAPIGTKYKYSIVARLQYVASLLGVIDLLAVMPYVVSKFFPHNELTNLVMEFTKLFLIFKLVRYTESFRLISAAFSSVKNELMAGLSIAGVAVVFSALAMYYVERTAQPEAFNNVGQGFWWAIVTFTTVGYGDIYPITPVGKILASVVGIIGISMIALPTGILSSAFMSHFSKRKRSGLSENNEGSRCAYCPYCGGKLPEVESDNSESDGN